MKIELNISKAVVLSRAGTDIVSLQTDCPSPFPPEVSNEPLTISFETRKGDGVDYVKKNFNMDAKVINILSVI